MKKVIINLATIYLEKKLFKMKITRNINICFIKKYWYAAPTNLVPCLFIDFVNRKHTKHLHVLIIIKSLTAQEIGELLVFKVHW